MSRLSSLVAHGLLLSGCVSTNEWLVSESDADARQFATITETFRDRPVKIHTETESHIGQFVEARADSTLWIGRDGSARSIATRDVRGIRSRDRTARSRISVGTGVALSTFVFVEGVPGTRVRGIRDANTTPQRLGVVVYTLAAAGILGAFGEWLGRSMERKDEV